MDGSDGFTPEEFENDLQDSYLAGFSSVVDSSDLVGGANLAASEYAKSRAANLVTLVSETTKQKIRNVLADAFKDPGATIESITEGIDGTGAFSDYRASLIAQTEVARAQMQGSLGGWKTLGVTQVQSLPGIGACIECLEIAAQGPMDIEDAADFPWHPNCNCTLVAVGIE